MLKLRISSSFTLRTCSILMLGGLLSLSLAGCDLAKNQLKIDRSSDMEVQDYRDALAPRLPDIAEKNAPDSKIPDLKPYIATPTDRMKTMPLVSISVNQSIPLKDILYELAEQADYDIELDPRIRGSVIFSARNRPFDQVIDRLAESAGLRYKFEGDSVRVELDTPYHEIYKINYLSYVRTNTSSITNDVAVVSGEGADTGSSFKAEAKSENDFWAELDSNLQQILTVNRDAGTLRTQRDPRITNVSEAAAQVDPILMTANGEMTVAAPNAVLRVEPLSPEDDPDSQNQTGEDPFLPRFSLNKQAGMISVFASERLHKQVRDYLDMLRRSVTSQVLIEAKVLEVALNDEFAAGINWSLPGIFGSGTSFGVNSTGAGLIPRFEGPSDPGINLSAVYASGDLNAAVEAMARFGAVRALASPRLTVLNNQSAVLNVARNQVYFQLQLEREEREAPEPDRVNINSNIRNVPEGVLINVQPAINLEERVVSMAVRPTVTRIVDYVNDPGVTIVAKDMGVDVESPVPVVNVQEFDSVIQMNSGQAIVLGGLIQDRTTSVQNAVPVLGEVPLFGALFRNQGDKIEKTELVVFLKATIMEGGNNVHNTDRDLYRTFSQDRRPFDL